MLADLRPKSLASLFTFLFVILSIFRTECLADSSFYTTYGSAGEDLLIYDGALIRSNGSDDGYVLAGTMGPHGDWRSDFNWIVIRTDPQGIKLWEKRFGGVDHDSAYSVAVDHESGNIAVVGRDDYTFGGGVPSGCKATVRILDRDGELLATSREDNNRYDAFYAVAFAPDGSIWAGGEQILSSGYQGLLNHYAIDGAKLSTLAWGVDSEVRRVSSLIVARDGDVVLTGSLSLPTTGEMEINLAKFAPDGVTMRWEKQYGVPGLPDGGHGITESREAGEFILVGSASIYRGNTSLAIGRIDSEGELLAANIWGYDWPGVFIYGKDVKETEEGKYRVATYMQLQDEEHAAEAGVIEFTNDLIPARGRFFGGAGSEGFGAIELVADGGVALLGYTSSKKYSGDDEEKLHGFLVKTDADLRLRR